MHKTGSAHEAAIALMRKKIEISRSARDNVVAESEKIQQRIKSMQSLLNVKTTELINLNSEIATYGYILEQLEKTTREE